LPRAMRISKVDLHAGSLGDLAPGKRIPYWVLIRKGGSYGKKQTGALYA
jgi:hypothetical protein